MRDLAKDLKICEAANKGPWEVKTNAHYETTGESWGWIEGPCENWCWTGKRPQSRADAQFVTAARTGWPEAIQRAMKAERVLNDIYPMIAGRVIQLQQAGEEKAAAEWNETAKAVYSVIKGGDPHA